MEYDCDRKLEAKTVKTEPDSEGGFTPVDKRVSIYLLNYNNNFVKVKIKEVF